MLSIRALVRSFPRAIARSSVATARNASTVYRQPSLLQSSWKLASRPRLSAAFSTGTRLWEKEGQVDDELAAKLNSELKLEKEMRDANEIPPSVKDFLDNGPFKIQDIPGREDVVMTRKFGDENIRLVFSIADLNNLDQDADKYDDRALYDEDEDDTDDPPMPTDTQSGGAQSKSTINAGRTKGGNIKVAPEDSLAPADRPELDDESSPGEDGSEEDQEPSFPARVNVTIEKAGKGALQIETIAQDGMIVIDNVYYYTDPAMANPKSPNQDLARRDMYLGPPFGNLDEDLQVMLERYLDERGINTALALFVPDYVDYKEQREYLRWLKDVKSFVEA